MLVFVVGCSYLSSNRFRLRVTREQQKFSLEELFRNLHILNELGMYQHVSEVICYAVLDSSAVITPSLQFFNVCNFLFKETRRKL